MEPIVVAVGCGAAGAASDLKINPPRLIKKGQSNLFRESGSVCLWQSGENPPHASFGVEGTSHNLNLLR
jgi:hypothetical protein